jgi:hypothetical protein
LNTNESLRLGNEVYQNGMKTFTVVLRTKYMHMLKIVNFDILRRSNKVLVD